MKPLLVAHPWGVLVIILVNAIATICIVVYLISVSRDTN